MSNKGDSSPIPAKRWSWRLLAYAISVAALAWVVVLWREQWPTVLEKISTGDRRELFLGLLLAMASGYANFIAFAVLVRSLIGGSLRLGELSHLYFVAQLLKHLPGRVWGIGYQAAMGKKQGAAESWVATNLVHMGAASYVALAMAAAVVAWNHGSGAFVLVLTVAIAGYFLALSLCDWLGSWLSARIGWRARVGKFLSLLTLGQWPWTWVFLAFTLAGLLHYGSWVMYASVIGIEAVDTALVLCALYMLAWFAGYIAFLTPSGIGVRELVFMGLATGFDADVVAVMAIFGRASFLAVDVLLSLPFLLRSPKP